MSNPSELEAKEYGVALELLRKIDFLQGVPEEVLKGILFSLLKQSFPPNKIILFQGEIGNRLFLIRKGTVLITMKDKGSKIQLAELKDPMYFGEISLLRPMSATATATAGAEGAEVLILTHDSITHLAKKIPDIQDRIQKVIDERLASRQKAKTTEENTENSTQN